MRIHLEKEGVHEHVVPIEDTQHQQQEYTCNVASFDRARNAAQFYLYHGRLRCPRCKLRGMKAKRGHSFGGCATCRRRHIKCDRSTPTCARCQRSGLSCNFAPALRWLVSTGSEALEEERVAGDDATTPHSKQHLYTEDARRSMSASLVSDLPSTVSAVLDRLDAIDVSSQTSDEACLHDRQLGSFGVFRACALLPGEHEDAFADPTPYPSPPQRVGMADISTSPGRATAANIQEPPNQTFGTFNADVEWHEDLDTFLTSSLDTVQWGDLFQWNLDFPTLTNTESNPLEPNSAGQICTSQGVERGLVPVVHRRRDEFSWPEMDLSSDAPLLLKHFNDQVITQMGSLPINEKSAWRTLNFPSAVFTLSQLTVLGFERSTIKRANLANFFAVIAVSALHLSLSYDAQVDSPNITDGSHHWKSLSDRTYEAAKDLMRSSLATESTLPGKAKYKDQLMAVGAVLAFALVSGNDNDVRTYLTEMERLIRSRGLTKRVISRRARLLHNVYAWMRIISESTNVLHDRSQLPNMAEPSHVEHCSTSELPVDGVSLHNSQESSARGLDNFLCLEEYKTQPDHDAHTLRDSSEGQLDLHLTSPIVDRDGMCMQIYGVPETWLRLVSQTTRLANMLDKVNPSTARADMEVFARLQATSATLEGAVCAFKERFQLPSPSASPHESMVGALSTALVIFFYRRIRSIRPLMLQESVTQVITSLHAFDSALDRHGMLGPGTAWPAFVAGAEAMHEPQRQAIASWLDRAHSKSAWKGYTSSRRVLHELWKRQDAVVGSGSYELPTWSGVCIDLQCWPLLC